MTPIESEGRSTGKVPSGVHDILRLFDGLPVAFLVLDPSGVVLWANSAGAEQLNGKPADIVGVDLFDGVLPALADVGAAFRARAGDPSLALSATVEVPSLPEPRTIQLSIRSLAVGETILGVVVIQDPTRAAEDEKRKKRTESLASVGELAAGLAHEVNNPLATIKSFGQLLLRDASSDEQGRALEMIIQETDRIGRSVENLVAFARQQGAGGRESINLSNLVERVIQVRRYSLEAAGIEVRMDLDPSVSAVMAEPAALQQVILNLVCRAESDLATRARDRMLIVRTRESSEGVMLYVVDNGPGIAREALPYLFQEYGPISEGDGFELATSARIVRDHGGYLFAESETGRGAAFFVRLPRAGGPPLSPAPSNIVRAATAPGRSLRILVADDEPTLRLAITLFLKRRGHQVTQASDAHEAYRLAKSQTFDAALVDARMPGDGLVLLDQLEAMPSLQGRTALMTGDLGRTRNSRGILTRRPYLVKPFDMNQAVTLLETLGNRGA